MNWQVEWLDEAKKDMRKLGKAEQIQVLKGIEKVRTNPLPTSQGGYGKPLRNAERTKLSRLCKIKFRDIGIRVVYEPLLRNGIMTIIVVGGEKVYDFGYATEFWVGAAVASTLLALLVWNAKPQED